MQSGPKCRHTSFQRGNCLRGSCSCTKLASYLQCSDSPYWTGNCLTVVAARKKTNTGLASRAAHRESGTDNRRGPLSLCHSKGKAEQKCLCSRTTALIQIKLVAFKRSVKFGGVRRKQDFPLLSATNALAL